MTDVNQNPTPQDWTSENRTYNDFFWGNPEAFKNLDKFEQLTNPVVSESESFDFEDITKPQVEVSEDVDSALSWDEEFLTPFDAPYNPENSEASSQIHDEYSDLPDHDLNNKQKYEELQTIEPIEEDEDGIDIDAPLVAEEANVDNLKAENIEAIDLGDVWWSEEMIEEQPISVDNDEDSAIQLSKDEEDSIIMESEKATDLGSPLEQDFQKLYSLGTSILHLEKKLELSLDSDSQFEILGEDSKNSTITYLIDLSKQNTLSLEKKNYHKQDNSESSNTLTISSLEPGKLEVFVDDFLLYQEELIVNDEKKQREVVNKIDKFIFLFEQKIKNLEQLEEEKALEEEKRKAFRDVFRNF